MSENAIKDLAMKAGLIKGALMVSVCVYFGVLLSQNEFKIGVFRMEDFLANELNPILTMMAVMSAVGGHFIRKIIENQPSDVTRGDSDRDPSLEETQKKFSALIIKLAIFESIAIYGLVIGMTSKNTIFMVPFALVALTLMFLAKFDGNTRKMGARQ